MVSVATEEEAVVVVVVYECAEEGEGVADDDVGGEATFAQICVSA